MIIVIEKGSEWWCYWCWTFKNSPDGNFWRGSLCRGWNSCTRLVPRICCGLFLLYFVTPSIISIIPIAHACTPRYHLIHMSMLGTFFTAVITFLFSWGFVLVRSSFAFLSLTFFVVYNTCENTYGAHTHNHHYDHLVSILRGGSLRSRHSPSRIQHFGKELKNNIWSSKEPKKTWLSFLNIITVALPGHNLRRGLVQLWSITTWPSKHESSLEQGSG